MGQGHPDGYESATQVIWSHWPRHLSSGWLMVLTGRMGKPSELQGKIVGFSGPKKSSLRY